MKPQKQRVRDGTAAGGRASLRGVWTRRQPKHVWCIRANAKAKTFDLLSVALQFPTKGLRFLRLRFLFFLVLVVVRVVLLVGVGFVVQNFGAK